MVTAVDILRTRLQEGLVIPACPLALYEGGRWSEQHQRALIRYYAAAGAGGIAVGVHSTQFAIRKPEHGLFRPVLELASSELQTSQVASNMLRIAGICGRTQQACSEASLAVELNYDAGLLSLADFRRESDELILEHCRIVGEIVPLIGFYLQPAVGGRILSYAFWREFVEIPAVVAIKIAPFNRYQTLDVVRALADSGRRDIALYTGNDDNIVADLLTPFRISSRTETDCSKHEVIYIAGGLLGQWGVWTQAAVNMLNAIKLARKSNTIDLAWLQLNAALTDANSAIFDAANQFAGCIPGILEVLRLAGLVPSIECLDRGETLSPGQAEEIQRVMREYPELMDDEFVKANRDAWLK